MSGQHCTNDTNRVPCCLCQSLVPLMGRLSEELSVLKARYETECTEHGLMGDINRVFESLSSATDQRERELLARVDDLYGVPEAMDTDLAGLISDMEFARIYCNRAAELTTKQQLLGLSDFLHARTDFLLQMEVPEQAATKSVIEFQEEELDHIVDEIDQLGKVYDEKDVSQAVQKRDNIHEVTIPEDVATPRPSLKEKDWMSFDEDTGPDQNQSNGDEINQKQSGKSDDQGVQLAKNDVSGETTQEDIKRSPTKSKEISNNNPVIEDAPNPSGRDERSNLSLENGDHTDQDAHRKDGKTKLQRQNEMDYSGTERRIQESNGEQRHPDLTSTRAEVFGQVNSADQGSQNKEKVEDIGRRSTTDDADGNLTTVREREQDGGDDVPNGENSCEEYRTYNNGFRMEPEGDKSQVSSNSGKKQSEGFLSTAMRVIKDQRQAIDNLQPSIDTISFTLEPESDQQDAILKIVPKKRASEICVKCIYLEFDRTTVFEDNRVTEDGKLVNEPPLEPHPFTTWRFQKYKGALATRPLDNVDITYVEFQTAIEIKEVHEGRSLIFEAAIGDKDIMDIKHKAEQQPVAWGLSLSNCPDHGGLCRRTWWAGQSGKHFPNTLPNEPGAQAVLHFGFLLLQQQKKLVVIDVKEEKVLMDTDTVRIARPLWPVFGVYNTELSHVEATIISGTSLFVNRRLAWMIYENITS